MDLGLPILRASGVTAHCISWAQRVARRLRLVAYLPSSMIRLLSSGRQAAKCVP